MNKFSIRILSWLFAFNLFFSCKKTDSIEIEIPVTGGGIVQPVGTPVSDNVTEIIGAAGGSIKSEDGRLELEIPAGALSEDTEIGIQLLNNTAAGGIGYSYRLTPHRKIFRKNVTIRFHYGKDQRRLSSKKALEIAFQNDEGEWVCKGNVINNSLENTLEVETDHFSDWALVASMELTPVVKTLGLGESTTLKAVRYIHPVNNDDFLVPLTIPNAATGQPIKLEESYIVRWTLDGPGQLTVNGSEAIYTAPATVPANKTATVAVELNVKGTQVLLISTIYIIDEGISLSIDGGPWHIWPGIATAMPVFQQYSFASLRIEPNVPEIVCLWPAVVQQKSNGIYGWNMLGNGHEQIIFQYVDVDMQHSYVSIYEDNNLAKDSPGFVSVEEKEEGDKKYITGIFAVDKAGRMNNSSGLQEGISEIMGTFKVQRDW